MVFFLEIIQFWRIIYVCEVCARRNNIHSFANKSPFAIYLLNINWIFRLFLVNNLFFLKITKSLYTHILF